MLPPGCEVGSCVSRWAAFAPSAGAVGVSGALGWVRGGWLRAGRLSRAAIPLFSRRPLGGLPGRGECREARERPHELLGPWPAGGQVKPRSSAGTGDPAGGVQQPVAQPFRLGAGELTVEQ